jgi:hypothetical protein
MGDVRCAKCSEPWDAYGVRNGDMEFGEAARFNRGEGCPSCRFGTACPLCDGSGRDDTGPWASCGTCRDKGYVLAWRPRNSAGRYEAEEFYVGYEPNVRHVETIAMGSVSFPVSEAEITIGVRNFPELIRVFQSADGRVEEWWICCPEGCAVKAADSCSSCGGTGKLKVEDPDGLALEAAKDACNESDEDPMGILIDRGLI